MFETLDTMISLAVVFLILSMMLKYFMSLIKRSLKIKAKVVSEEMTVFIGENTSKYLIPYLDKKARYLNFLQDIKKKDGLEGKGLRQLTKEQLNEVVDNLREFLESKTVGEVKQELGLSTTVDEIGEKIQEIKDHLSDLKGKIENNYNNTMEKISEVYEANLRRYTMIWGLVFALLINADFIDIYSTMSKDSVVRQNLAAQTEVIQNRMDLLSKQIDQQEKQEVTALKPFLDGAKTNVDRLTDEVKNAGLSLGWTKEKFSNTFKGAAFINKLIGLFISGLLISFGAPFWHDFLNTITGIKGILQGRGKTKT